MDNIINPETVIARLPFHLGIRKEVGFTFNILAYSFMCQLFEPAIEFHQIGELQKQKPKELFEKMVHGAALSYKHINKKKYDINAKLIHKWLNDLKHEEVEKLTSMLQVAILNGRIEGKTMSEHIEADVKKK